MIGLDEKSFVDDGFIAGFKCLMCDKIPINTKLCDLQHKYCMRCYNIIKDNKLLCVFNKHKINYDINMISMENAINNIISQQKVICLKCKKYKGILNDYVNNHKCDIKPIKQGNGKSNKKPIKSIPKKAISLERTKAHKRNNNKHEILKYFKKINKNCWNILGLQSDILTHYNELNKVKSINIALRDELAILKDKLNALNNVYTYKCYNIKQKSVNNVNIKSIYQTGPSTIFMIDNYNKLLSKGDNIFGQIGIDLLNWNQNSFKLNEFFNDLNINIISKSKNAVHTFIVTNGNKIYGCGRNNNGQIGLQTKDILMKKPTLLPIHITENILEIYCGLEHSILLTSSNKVHGCGNNRSFQIGLKNQQTYPSFILISSLNNIIKINACCNTSYFINNTGIIYTCGDNEYGLNGINNKSYGAYKITPIKSNAKFIDIKTGFEHIIALSDNNKLYSWGSNEYGQCGQSGWFYKSTIIHKPSIIKFNDEITFKIIASDSYSNIIMDNNSNLWVFGRNAKNECLISTKNDNIHSPKKISKDFLLKLFDFQDIKDIIPIYSHNEIYFNVLT